MEIINGIHRIDEASENMAHANVYLVINGKELAIIDTGTPGNAQKIIGYVEKKGFKPTDVKFIVLTHHHMDHMGSAKKLRDLTKAQVAVHENDADFVSGEKPLPALKYAHPRAAITIESVPVDIRLKEATGSRVLSSISYLGTRRGASCYWTKRERCSSPVIHCGTMARR